MAIDRPMGPPPTISTGVLISFTMGSHPFSFGGEMITGTLIIV